MSLLTVRSQLDFESDLLENELFAFRKIPNHSQLALYGAGTFGQHLKRMIEHAKNHTLVGWYDNNHEVYRSCNLEVSDIQTISKNKFDFIVIAYINEKHTQSIFQTLLEQGIDQEKILRVEHFAKVPVENLLENYGIELNE